ncbi:MAG TPA: hypothetical protein VMP11_04475 [Verrucomicrobiae bacterium]|nr:hypothetical protein [Verrucomicrobiae bacterium]
MKPGWRFLVLFRALSLLLVAVPLCQAAWDFTAPGDPNRSWSASWSSSAEYDDNFNSSEFNRQSGYRLNSDLSLRAKAVGERSLLSGQYDYQTLYPNYNRQGGVADTHELNASMNYSINPRLLLSLNDNFVNSIEPSLVQSQNGTPITLIQSGTYIYNNVAAGTSYALTRRWSVSFAGNWDVWSYENSAFATNNNHEDYSMTLSLLYGLDSRTVVGVNYQYSGTMYTDPGFKNGLNSDANSGYLSLTRQFNPKFSLALNGGYTVRNSEDGSTSTGPSAYGALIYNYGPASSVSLVAAESLNAASIGVSHSFSAQQNTSISLKVNHRFTARLHTELDASYVYSTFTLPLVEQTVQTLSPNDQLLTFHWNMGYDFRQWISAGVNYDYTRVLSSNALLVQPYSRNQVSATLTLTY